MTQPCVDMIQSSLEQALHPVKLEIFDDSQSHAGHPGIQSGGHFHALIVADAFAGKSRVQRHQLVYRALGDMMKTDIHAFSMQVFTPEEYNNKENQ